MQWIAHSEKPVATDTLEKCRLDRCGPVLRQQRAERRATLPGRPRLEENNPITRRLATMNFALRGIEAAFAPENADTFRRDPSIPFQSPTRFLKAA